MRLCLIKFSIIAGVIGWAFWISGALTAENDPLRQTVRAENFQSVIDYRNQIVEVEGLGASVPGRGSLARQRVWALEEARRVAYLRLAETIGGIRLEGKSTLIGSQLAESELRIAVRQFINGAHVADENVIEMEDGSFLARVRLRLMLTGENSLTEFVWNNFWSQTNRRKGFSPHLPGKPRSDYTGVVLKAGSGPIKLGLAPRILLPDNSVIYSWEDAHERWIRKWGVVQYVTDIRSAAERTGSNPLVVSASPAIDRESPDLIIWERDIPAVKSCSSNIWKECRVVVLIR